MTEAEFEQLLRQTGDSLANSEVYANRLAEVLAPLSERERKKLANTARQRHREVLKNPFQGGHPFLWLHITELAVLATGPLSDARRIRGMIFQHEAATIKVLVDRRPDWIDAWLDHMLSARRSFISWNVVRSLVRAGVCQKPSHRKYFELMAFGMSMSHRHDERAGSILEQLSAEPDLLEDVWRLNGYVFYDESSPWTSALIELTENGVLDRQRALDCILKVLDTDVDAPAGYLRLYAAMKPTPEERVARQARFLELLSHRESSIVGFALAELAAIEKQGTLDGDGFLNAVRSVFALKPKGQPLAALKLADRLAGREPRYVPGTIDAAIEALAHDSTAVQEKAVELLHKHKQRLHRDHLAELRQRLDTLAPSVRLQVLSFIGGPDSNQGQPTADDSTLPAESNLDDLQSRAANIPGTLRQLAGIDEALAAISEKRLPAPLSFDLLEVPLLTGVAPVVPIQTIDELLDAVAHGLETVESGDQFERILDGISRLCGDRPTDFELRAAPLAKRLRDITPQDPSRGLAHPPTQSIRSLLYAWLVGRALVAPADASLSDWRNEAWMAYAFAHVLRRFDGLAGFVDARMEEIERRVFLRQPSILLSAPTHERGWINPRELVRRLKQAPPDQLDLRKADLIQALLRLASDHRNAALVDAADIPGLHGRIVRWAFGGDDGPTETDADEFDLWLAAGRCRNPTGRLKELAVLKRAEGDVALEPASYNWNTKLPDNTERRWIRGGEVPFNISPVRQKPSGTDVKYQPTLALSCAVGSRGWSASNPWITDWIATIWPANVDPLLAEGARALTQRVNSPASMLEPNYPYLAPLLEPDRPWTELAHLVTWIGLVSKDADSRGSAIDAIIAAIEDGRADWQAAADVLLRLLPGEWVKLNRVADAGREVSRVSPLHSWWVAEFLQSFIAGLDEAPRDLHHVLTLLLELLSGLQLGLAAPARERLAALEIPGRGGKAVEQLLALAPAEISADAKKALDQCAKSRINRALRWQRRPA